VKSKKLIFYSGLLITSFSYVCGMNELVKKEIDKVEQKFNETAKDLSFDECLIFGVYDQHREDLAKVVFDKGILMTDTEKLNNLLGDSFFEARKKIITTMIDEKKIHPNNILYQDGANPLSEAVTHRNIDFTKYLLEKGANPDKTTLERMVKDPKFAELFLKY